MPISSNFARSGPIASSSSTAPANSPGSGASPAGTNSSRTPASRSRSRSPRAGAVAHQPRREVRDDRVAGAREPLGQLERRVEPLARRRGHRDLDIGAEVLEHLLLDPLERQDLEARAAQQPGERGGLARASRSPRRVAHPSPSVGEALDAVAGRVRARRRSRRRARRRASRAEVDAVWRTCSGTASRTCVTVTMLPPAAAIRVEQPREPARPVLDAREEAQPPALGGLVPLARRSRARRRRRCRRRARRRSRRARRRTTAPESSAATPTAPAPSTTSLARSSSTTIASATSSSPTTTISSTHACTSGSVSPPGRLIAMPSAIVGPPATVDRLAALERRPDRRRSSRPARRSTRTPGRAALSTPATPPISPPPPTGTTTVAISGDVVEQLEPERRPGRRRSCGSSNGCTKMAPVCSARSRARADAVVDRVAAEPHRAAEAAHRGHLGQRGLGRHEDLARRCPRARAA